MFSLFGKSSQIETSGRTKNDPQILTFVYCCYNSDIGASGLSCNPFSLTNALNESAR